MSNIHTYYLFGTLLLFGGLLLLVGGILAYFHKYTFSGIPTGVLLVGLGFVLTIVGVVLLSIGSSKSKERS